MKCENCHTFIDYENLTSEVINEAEASLLKFLSKTDYKIKRSSYENAVRRHINKWVPKAFSVDTYGKEQFDSLLDYMKISIECKLEPKVKIIE